MLSLHRPPSPNLGESILGIGHQCNEACGIVPGDCPFLWPDSSRTNKANLRKAAERDAQHRAIKTAELLRHPVMQEAFLIGLREPLCGLIREVVAADLPEALRVLGAFGRRDWQ